MENQLAVFIIRLIFEGCAAFNLDGKKLTIYEGGEDGSDNKELNIIEFLFNYEFKNIIFSITISLSTILLSAFLSNLIVQ